MVGSVNEQCSMEAKAQRAGHVRSAYLCGRGALVPMAATIPTDIKCAPTQSKSYLLGLLAMIKCSICSYQCDN